MPVLLIPALEEEDKRTLWGDLLVVAAMAMFGSYSLFLRLCPQISPLAFLGAFQLVGAVAFSFIAYFQKTPQLVRRDFFLFGALAVVAILNDLCYFFALTLTSVANAAVAHQSVSIFLLVFAPLILKERTQREEWVALVVSVIGIGVLYSDQLGVGATWENLRGITLGLASGFFYAFLIIFYRIIPDERRGITVVVVNAWRYSISCVLLAPFVQGMHLGGFRAHDLIPLAGFGILFAVIASGLHTYGLKKTRSLHSSILGKTEPVFAIGYAFFFLFQLPTSRALVGAACIIGSSLWLILKKGKELV